MTGTREVAVIVKPWYRQFYLCRGDAEWCSDQVSTEGYALGLEAIDGFVYVATTMYGSPTRVCLRTHHPEPGPPASADRVAEDVLTGAGELAVLNWEPGQSPAARVALRKGDVRMRASWYGIADAEAHPNNNSGGEATSPEPIILDFWPPA